MHWLKHVTCKKRTKTTAFFQPQTENLQYNQPTSKSKISNVETGPGDMGPMGQIPPHPHAATDFNWQPKMLLEKSPSCIIMPPSRSKNTSSLSWKTNPLCPPKVETYWTCKTKKDAPLRPRPVNCWSKVVLLSQTIMKSNSCNFYQLLVPTKYVQPQKT